MRPGLGSHGFGSTSSGLVRCTGLLASLSAACGGDLTLPGQAEPASLVVVSGNQQDASVGGWLSRPLVVRVQGSDSRPLGGVRVTSRFADEVPGSNVDPELVQSNEEGEASTRDRLGSSLGEQLVVAAVDGSNSPSLRATFRLTALPREGTDGDEGGNGGAPGGDDNGSGGAGGGGSGDGDDHDDHDEDEEEEDND